MDSHIIKIIRSLAKSNEYQTLYSGAKEIGLKMFKNDFDYSDLQIIFLNYISFYSSLYIDIYLKEIDEKVLDNEIYEDAYSYYKSKKSNKKDEDIHNRNKKIVKEQEVKSQWHFRRR